MEYKTINHPRNKIVRLKNGKDAVETYIHIKYSDFKYGEDDWNTKNSITGFTLYEAVDLVAEDLKAEYNGDYVNWRGFIKTDGLYLNVRIYKEIKKGE